MKKIIITGCHGLLGQKLYNILKYRENRLYGLDLHTESYFPITKDYTYFCCDLREEKSVERLLLSIKPDVIINTAAMTQVDACETEREQCRKINFDAVIYLVDAARLVNADLVQISTDYIFDGTKGPYCEEDTPNPLSYYAKTKLEAEKVISGSGLNTAILRTNVLFGHGIRLKTDFVGWVLSRLRMNKPMSIVTDQISNVTLVDDLANAIKRVIELKKWGIYHTAGSEILSRFDFTIKIAEVYGYNQSLIKKTLTKDLKQAAPRPLRYGGLIVDKAQRKLGIKFRNVRDSLFEYRRQERMNNNGYIDG